MKTQNIIICTIAIAIIIAITTNHQQPEKDTPETTTHNQQTTDR